MHLNWLANIELKGPGPHGCQYDWLLLLYSKNAKKIESKETMGFFWYIFIIGGISIAKGSGPCPPPPFGNAYGTIPYKASTK